MLELISGEDKAVTGFLVLPHPSLSLCLTQNLLKKKTLALVIVYLGILSHSGPNGNRT